MSNLSEDKKGQKELKNGPNEEIDLLQLLVYFENKVKGLFRLVGKALKLVFSGLIILIRPLFANYLLIAIVLVVSAVLGYVAENLKPDQFSSSMLVRTHFDSKYQMVSSVSYYNSLISDEKYDELSSIFDMQAEDVQALQSFEVLHGPEDENTLLKGYDNFVRSIDSIRREEISYEDYIENRSIYEGSLFFIKVISKKPDIFGTLEEKMSGAFENEFTQRNIAIRDSVINLRKGEYREALKNIDSLKKVYLTVISEEAKSPIKSMTMGESGILPIIEKTKTREYELLEQQLNVREKIRLLDEELASDNLVYEVLSGFQRIGQVEKEWSDRYSLLFPAAAFVLMILTYWFFRINTFVRNYEI